MAARGGARWIGVFYGGDDASPSALDSHVVGMPDGRSFGVVYRGVATIVRSQNPLVEHEVPCWPVTDMLVVPERQLVLFADFVELAAYDSGGLVWRTGRIALDDLKIVGVHGNVIRVAGFFGDADAEEFEVDIVTGAASGQPFDPR